LLLNFWFVISGDRIWVMGLGFVRIVRGRYFRITISILRFVGLLFRLGLFLLSSWI